MSAEYHVSIGGNDTSPGTAGAPLRTIQAAAQLAQPGDTITVHGGTYRERIDPPRGGSSDSRRITFQAAPGEKVVIKGSEPVKTWEKHEGPVWKASFPNSFFGGRNPYRELIEGDWFLPEFGPVHTGEVYLNGRFFTEVQKQENLVNPLARLKTMDRWFCTGDAETTTIFANFGDRDPNGELVEINVRETCFYPSKPGIDFITVRGFIMCQAATQWSAPTAEQVGLIGTNASKGWIIEGNTVSDSRCAGITLGKSRETGHNVWTANPKLDGTNLYNEMVDAEFAVGWAKSKTGSHIVRQNTISNCEQAGICGSITPAFSLIEDNHIFNIHVRNQFAGWEQAAIKFHGAIDVVVRRNRIHHSNRGMWFDWMAQGTRITGNLLYDNGDGIFVEVNHGPFVLDNNIIVGGVALRDMSEGGTYAHNLFAGPIVSQPVYDRVTPFMEAHSTKPLGRAVTQGGDNRFFNNIFVGDGSPRPAGERNPKEVLGGFGLWVYDSRPLPSFAGGNLYLHGAAPYKDESATVRPAEPGVVNGSWVNFPGYALISQPDPKAGEFRAGGISSDTVEGGKVGAYKDFIFFSVKPGASVRLGILVDAFKDPAYAADAISVCEVATGAVVYSETLSRDGVPDLVVFDLTNLSGGEVQYNVALHTQTPSLTGFSLLTFDPVP